MRKTIFGFVIIITAVLVSVLTAAAAVCAVVLLSAGLLSVFVSLGSIILPVKNVASDLSPPAMLFTGFFCIFAASSLGLSLYILCPKAARRFNLVTERLFL